jgi:uncharacterized membrane protein
MNAKTSNTSSYDEGGAPTVPQLNAIGTVATVGPVGTMPVAVEVVEAVEKATPPRVKAPSKSGSRQAGSAKWLITGLLLLSAIPMVAGASRLSALTTGAQVTPANARFFDSPLPVVVHIVCASLYALLGAFQFSTPFRRSRPRWHHMAGRLLVPAGLLVGLSALWMTLFYPRPAGDGDLLAAFRLLFGSAMIASIVMGYTAIRRGDVKGHRAWMMRGYAIGLGAGTQALVLMVGAMVAGPPDELSRALLMGLAWVINVGVAEWGIRRLKLGHNQGHKQTKTQGEGQGHPVRLSADGR